MRVTKDESDNITIVLKDLADDLYSLKVSYTDELFIDVKMLDSAYLALNKKKAAKLAKILLYFSKYGVLPDNKKDFNNERVYQIDKETI